MSSVASPSLQLEIPASGDYRGSWADVMARLLTQLDKSIAGTSSITTTGGDVTLTDTQYVDNQSRQAILSVSGTLTADATLIVPARSKRYIIVNNTIGAFNLSIKTAGGTPLQCPVQGSTGEIRVASDGTIFRIGPYVDKVTGAITSTFYATQAALNELSDETETLVKRDGSRSFSAPVGGQLPTANNHLVTKEYADRIAGIQDNAFLTSGTSSAYVINTGADITLTDGVSLTILPHTPNDWGVTLKVDGNAPKPINGNVEGLPPGTLFFTPYRVTYYSGVFFINSFIRSAWEVPIGAFLPYCANTLPNSLFAFPNGQALSRTGNSALFNLIGTTFGVGNGVDTFNIPDLRGRIPLPLDNLGGSAAGRVNGNSGFNGNQIGFAGGLQSFNLGRGQLPNFTLSGSGGTDGQGDHAHNVSMQATGRGGGSGNTWVPGGATATTNAGFHAHGVGITTESINGGVTQQLTSIMQPSIMMPWIMRVL